MIKTCYLCKTEIEVAEGELIRHEEFGKENDGMGPYVLTYWKYIGMGTFDLSAPVHRCIQVGMYPHPKRKVLI